MKNRSIGILLVALPLLVMAGTDCASQTMVNRGRSTRWSTVVPDRRPKLERMSNGQYYIEYKVKSTDSFKSICREFDVSEEALIAVNRSLYVRGRNAYVLTPTQYIRIPLSNEQARRYKYALAGVDVSSDDGNSSMRIVAEGEGRTKDEAVSRALRSAVEQTFGTFVSANTSILNDDIVKDEVATVSSGNVISYKELSSIRLPSDRVLVQVEAVVSIRNLVTYAKQRGSSVEFAGKEFAMNLKIRQFNKQNEEKVIGHMIDRLRLMSGSLWNVKGRPGTPVAQTDGMFSLPLQIQPKGTDQYSEFLHYFHSTLASISLSKKEQLEYEETGTRVYTVSTSGGSTYILRSSALFDNAVVLESLFNFKPGAVTVRLDGLDNRTVHPQFNGKTPRIGWEITSGQSARRHAGRGGSRTDEPFLLISLVSGNRETINGTVTLSEEDLSKVRGVEFLYQPEHEQF